MMPPPMPTTASAAMTTAALHTTGRSRRATGTAIRVIACSPPDTSRSMGRNPSVRAGVGESLIAREQGLHAGSELAGAERLGDVVVGAGVEAGLDVGLLGAGREEDDREV